MQVFSSLPAKERSLLQSATRQHHRRLDRHPVMRPIVESDVGIKDYMAALSLMHEQWAFWQNYAPWAETYCRALAADVGIAPQPVQQTRVMPRHEHLAWAYVMWGSTLGARAIEKKLQHRALPQSFFAQASKPIDFPEVFDAPIERVCEAAQDVFEIWLQAADAQHGQVLECAS